MPAPLIDMVDLNIEIPTPSGMLQAVRGISLTVAKGEALGIVGESGSGKSLTAMAIMRLLPRVARMRAQKLDYDGQSLLEIADDRFAADYLGPRLAMIFQEPMTSLNPVYTIGRQLTEASIRNGRMNRAEALRHAVGLLDRVGIPDPEARMSQYPHQMSGGQRQRVMIAIALMQDPELLIADEPTTALDVTVQAQIMALLDELRRERGMSLILITHDLALISQSVDRVAVMYGGEIVEQGEIGAVLSKPAHPYTRALLAAVPRLEGVPHKLASIPGTVPTILTQPKGCVFAPRCAHRQLVCRSQRPPLLGDARHSRLCILADEDIRKLPPVISQERVPSATAQGGVILEARQITRLFESRRGLFGPKHRIRAVDNVNLTLSRGETLAVVGESGSGKSTLAKIMLGLDEPTSGEVLLDGEPVAAMDARRRAALVQPIFQDPYSSLNPRRTVGEIIARPLELLHQGSAADRLARVQEQMTNVRLPQRLLHSYPSQLSGGQRQRVAIARALISSPEILVCDEPTSALDVSVQAQILDLLIDLQSALGLTCLLITHDMAVVRQVASRVAVMLDGAIVEEGAVASVMDHPKTGYTKRLVAAAPKFRQETHDQSIADREAV